jgi:hypothetical protein
MEYENRQNFSYVLKLNHLLNIDIIDSLKHYN